MKHTGSMLLTVKCYTLNRNGMKKKEEEEIEKQGSHVQYSYDSQVQCAKKKVE